jgi:ParB-like chromosome segregation protein Spo0J
MRAGEFDALRESIRENGQREAITLLDGAVIDGIHREAACLELAVEPKGTTSRGTPRRNV